jgi:hypothetical protein
MRICAFAALREFMSRKSKKKTCFTKPFLLPMAYSVTTLENDI